MIQVMPSLIVKGTAAFIDIRLANDRLRSLLTGVSNHYFSLYRSPHTGNETSVSI